MLAVSSAGSPLRNNAHNPKFAFHRPPVEFDKNTDKALLQYCLGGTLYMPACKDVTTKIVSRRPPSNSMVMDFEDALRAADLPRAEANALLHLDVLADALDEGRIGIDDVPLTFFRVRDVEQFIRFSARLTARQTKMLSGFVFPKFNSNNAAMHFDCLDALNARLGLRLYAMPILEGPAIAFIETRRDELLDLKRIIDAHRERVLNVRVGGTDFSSFFGVRRDINTSIYNIAVVRDCLADILNYFNRSQDGYVVSAPVWEYFLAYKKADIAQLVEGDTHQALFKRSQIINEAIDGLIREVVMDRANGFVGKTIIHPSHLRFVNGMQAVTREEYEDALQITGECDGVVKSGHANKMNEINPHRNWAQRILRRSDAFGVVENEDAYLQLILGSD
jgi:citrate lyase beta subunit